MGRRGLSPAPARGLASLAAAGLLVLLAACGSQTPSPQLLHPAPPGGLVTRRYSEVGLRLARPRNWTPVTVHLPLVTLVSSGPAVISLWRYPPSSGSPSTPAELTQALHRLESAARLRDHTLRVLSSSTGSVAGLPAVQLQTIQHIHGALRRVYSTHLYRPAGEVVLEEYAPLSLFPGLERTVFSGVRRSLTPATT